MHAALPQACNGWGLSSTKAQAPVVTDRPVLLISALRDVRTPHEQALAVQLGLSNATLITLVRAGHADLLGPGAELDRAIDAFLRGKD